MCEVYWGFRVLPRDLLGSLEAVCGISQLASPAVPVLRRTRQEDDKCETTPNYSKTLDPRKKKEGMREGRRKRQKGKRETFYSKEGGKEEERRNSPPSCGCSASRPCTWASVY